MRPLAILAPLAAAAFLVACAGEQYAAFAEHADRDYAYLAHVAYYDCLDSCTVADSPENVSACELACGDEPTTEER
jgi:hypothetical protein